MPVGAPKKKKKHSPQPPAQQKKITSQFFVTFFGMVSLRDLNSKVVFRDLQKIVDKKVLESPEQWKTNGPWFVSGSCWGWRPTELCGELRKKYPTEV